MLALALDVLVLGAMLTRVGECGFTPNRAAALGLNLVLLVNLASSAWRSWKFFVGRGTLHRLERWQTAYLPVLGVWGRRGRARPAPAVLVRVGVGALAPASTWRCGQASSKFWSARRRRRAGIIRWAVGPWR